MASSSAALRSSAAESLLESAFLVLVYGFVMYRGSKLVNEGRRVLLQIFTPGITAAMFLTLVSSLPTAIVILTSGVQGTASTAQDRILIGMGSLAGSSVMLLTLLWGSCVITHIRTTGHGIRTDSETSHAARIKLISVLPFIIIILLPLAIQTAAGVRLLVLVSLIVSVALTISYGVYQVYVPWIQSRRLAFVHHDDAISLEGRGLDKLLWDDGKPNIIALEKLFKALDSDSDGTLSASELRALIIGVQFDEIDLGINQSMLKHLEESRTSDGRESGMGMDEFIQSMSEWLVESRRPGRGILGALKFKYLLKHKKQLAILTDKDAGGSGRSAATAETPRPSDEAVIAVKNWGSKAAVAALKLLTGVVLVAASAYPLVDVVDSFSSDSSIPLFFVSFVVMPFACHSWVWSALLLSRKRKPRMLSLTFSEIYEAVTVNNIFCLAVFLAIVFARDLTWEFSSEALTVLVVAVVIGCVAGFMSELPLWTSILAYAMYPFALALVYVLRYVLGLS